MSGSSPDPGYGPALKALKLPLMPLRRPSPHAQRDNTPAADAAAAAAAAATPSTAADDAGEVGGVVASLSSSSSSSSPAVAAADVEAEAALPPAAARRARTSKPKVRTGCQTCKIRRVKCDEAKPACQRCTSTGRQCDGYSIPPRKKRSDRRQQPGSPGAPPPSPPRPPNLIVVAPGTAAERRAVDFFHTRTSVDLASYFDGDFWRRLVLQMGHTEPAIRHAMVAIGTLHRQRAAHTKPRPMLRSIGIRYDACPATEPLIRRPTNHNDPFALQQYNAAIRHLSQRLQDPDAATEVALLASILFVCLEFLRGDADPAVRHFKGGMNIAITALSGDPGLPPPAASTVVRIRENLLPFLNRVELLSRLFGNEATWDYPVSLPDAVPLRFLSIKDARDSQVHVMNLGMRFVHRVGPGRYDAAFLPGDWVEKAALQRASQRWETALNDFLHTHVVPFKDFEASRVLLVHKAILDIWLSISMEAAECASDAHIADFEHAVSLCEALQSYAGTREQRQTYPSTFLFDMEVVSPLYFVGINCRHRLIRRRAIQLLRHTVRREGLWDSNVAAAIAERVMAIEESELDDVDLDSHQLPSERARVHGASIQSPSGLNPAEHKVTFSTKPHGLDRPWVKWTEKVIVLEMPDSPADTPT